AQNGVVQTLLVEESASGVGTESFVLAPIDSTLYFTYFCVTTTVDVRPIAGGSQHDTRLSVLQGQGRSGARPLCQLRQDHVALLSRLRGNDRGELHDLQVLRRRSGARTGSGPRQGRSGHRLHRGQAAEKMLRG